MPYSPRGIEQSLVLTPRWPLILYTGTLYCIMKEVVTLLMLGPTRDNKGTRIQLHFHCNSI